MTRLFLPGLLLAAGFTVALLALTSGAAHADSRRGGDAIGAVVDDAAGRPGLRDTGVPAQAQHAVAAARETIRETTQRVPQAQHAVAAARETIRGASERVIQTTPDSREDVDRAAQNAQKRAFATVREAEARVGDAPVLGEVAPRLRLADRLELLVRIAGHTAGSPPVPELDGAPDALARRLRGVTAATATKTLAMEAPVAAHRAPERDAARVAARVSVPAGPTGVPAETFGTSNPGTGPARPASPDGPVPSGTRSSVASVTDGGVMALTEAQPRLDLGLGVAVARAARANPPLGPALRPGAAPD